jgi:hypothetical protein
MLPASTRALKHCVALCSCVAVAVCAAYVTESAAQTAKEGQTAAMANSTSDASPIYGVTIPLGYGDWKLIAVNQLVVAGKTDQLRAQLGNEMSPRRRTTKL